MATTLQREEVITLYRRMRRLHERGATLLAKLGSQYDSALWREIHDNDKAIATLWDQIRQLEGDA